MSIRFGRHVAAAVVAYFLLSPGEASAKFFLITSGDTIADLGSITGKAEVGAKGGALPGLKVGYKYSYGGLFWIDFWTWGGEYCIYQDKNFEPIPQELAAALVGKSPGELKPPFLYRFPLGLLILAGFAVLGVIGAIAKRKGKGSDTTDYERA